ncbi:MAG: DUF2178 domain-containing protein [Candidatus Bathyarchaeota archaeon]|nr:DUF2178 domain-containing protein [Candidatus Bathyarchaeota archaeon]
MDKETYNRVKIITGAGVSIIAVYSSMVNSWALASSAIVLAIVIIIAAKQSVDQVLYDERTKTVREKSANATLGIVTIGFAAVGLMLIETSFWGYTANEEYGYIFAYISLLIMAINGFFNWYYDKQLGG